MSALAQIVLAHGENNDGTAFPWWGIAEEVKIGSCRNQYAILAGPFFSRESAKSKLEARRHHYGKRAIVYCFSGHDSPDYRELFALAKSDNQKEATR